MRPREQTDREEGLGAQVLAWRERAMKAEAFLGREGYRRCDIPACNCGSWHQTGGFAARFREIEQVVEEAVDLNGKTLLAGVREVVDELNRIWFVVEPWGGTAETIEVICERLREAEAALAEGITHPSAGFRAYLRRHMDWSLKTFGPATDDNNRTEGILHHLGKELDEVRANPSDVEEWVDLMILAIDGAWRNGATPGEIAEVLLAKQEKNKARTWGDWRSKSPDEPIEHDRTGEA